MGFLIIELVRHESAYTKFRVNGRDLVCERSERLPSDSITELGAFLATAASSRQDDDTVILAIDPSLFSCREISLPLTERRKIREVLPMELKGETACDTDELVFDCIVRSNGTQLAVWGRRHDLVAPIELLAAAGLDPQAVTASLFHWHYLLPSGNKGSTILMADTYGAALYRDSEPVVFRTFREENPLVEIDRTVNGIELTQEVTVAPVYLLGELAEQSRPDGREGVWVPLPYSAELETAFGGDLQSASAGAHAYALARAARKGDLINFRHGSLACTSGSQKLRKKLLVSAILASVALLIVCIDMGMRYVFVKKDLDSLNRSIGAIYHEIFPTRKKAVDEVGEVKSEIRRLSGAGSGIAALATLKQLAEVKGEDIAGFYETELEGNQVRLKGDAKSVQAVTALKTRAGAVLTGIEVGEIRTKPDGTVAFSLRGSLKESGR